MKGTMTNGVVQSPQGHTMCCVAIDTGAFDKILVIILLPRAQCATTAHVYPRESASLFLSLSLSLRGVGPHVLSDTAMCA